MRISDWSSDVCSSDLDGDAQGAERAGAGQFAKEDPARILVHHRGAAHRIGTQVVEDALHRRLPALQFAAVEQQLADADIAAAVLRVVTDAHDVAARQPQAARPLNMEEEEFGGIGGPSDFESASTEEPKHELPSL